MPTFPSDSSLLSTAYTTLLLTYYLALLLLSFIIAMTLPYTTFHLGRWIAGEHFDVGHPGSLIAMFVGFVMYSALCGLGEGLEWYLVNVPFGVGVLCVVVLGVWAVGVGVWRGFEWMQGTRGLKRD